MAIFGQRAWWGPGNVPKLSTIRHYAHALEALVVHRTALDEGRLFTDNRDDWDMAAKGRSAATRASRVWWPLRLPRMTLS